MYATRWWPFSLAYAVLTVSTTLAIATWSQWSKEVPVVT